MTVFRSLGAGLAGVLGAWALAACAPAPASLQPSTPEPTRLVTAMPPSATAPASTATPAPAFTPSATATSAPSATPTTAPTSTGTPTARPIIRMTLAPYFITPAADATLITPYPTPMGQVDIGDESVNILLLGSDWRTTDPITEFRTDTLIVVNINKSTGAVTMLSIPRDLFIYAPSHGMMRINTAYQIGERFSYSGGGAGLLKQTLLYNFGLPIHYYALVRFDGFRQVVDTMGGIEVPVNCTLVGKLYYLKGDDPAIPQTELYTVTAGVQTMPGDVALWYARVRPVGGDFFRNYRQRQVLRAIYQRALSANIIPQIPALYADFMDVVQTDLGLWDGMQFVPLTARIQDAQIRSVSIGPNQVIPWVTPKGDQVLLPRPGAFEALIRTNFTAGKTAATPTPTPIPLRVEIINASGQPGLDRLAAETLRNEGFTPVLGTPAATPLSATTLTVFGGLADPAIARLQDLSYLPDRSVLADPATNSTAPLRLTLGADYQPCPRLDWLPSAPNTEPTITP